ncbi:MAG: DUF4469 domain-containing protein [Prevotellaceae bacterium]|jgi:hypothetical protein|nr:DUF4469 domain-containing protein [Prevotellaceae bacterium]
MSTLASKDMVLVELRENKLTGRPDDFYGRVVNRASITEEKLIERVVGKGSDISAITLRAAYHLLKEEALQALVCGDIVDFGLGRIFLRAEGVFESSSADWNPEEHRLSAHIAPSKKLRETLKNTPVKIFGKAPDKHGINAVTDITTGETNRLLTRGCIARITGRMIKIAGNLSGIGLWLTNHATGEKYPVPPNAIGVNLPSELYFTTPDTLPPGGYTLCIVTQFTPGRLLITPCTIPLSHVLDVI